MGDESQGKTLGVVLVVGGCGFLGANLVDQLLNFPSEDKLPPHDPTLKQSSIVISSTHSFPSLRSRYPSYNQDTTQVHAVDLRTAHNRHPFCTYHTADITDADALLEVFRTVKPDVVINTASPNFDAPAAILRKVNIEGTRILLDVAGGQKYGSWGGQCKVFVHTSSSSVVHDTQSDLINADESYPYVCPNTREYYSETKVYAERMVLEANDDVQEFGGMLTCAVRPAGVIGEGDRSGFGYSIVKQAQVAPDWQLYLQLGDGSNLFDTTYVGNVAYGLLCAAEALLETWVRKKQGKSDILDHERVDGEAFNVTNDQPAYFWDLARFLYTRYGREIKADKIWVLSRSLAMFTGYAAQTAGKLTGRQGRFSPQTVQYALMDRWYSCKKLKRRVGYRPVVSVEEGLERTVRWCKEAEEREQATGTTEKKSQ